MKYFSSLPSLFTLFTLFSLFSCGESYDFEVSQKIPESGWTYENVLKFEFSVEDTKNLYDLFLRIDYTTDFPRQNIYTNIYTGSDLSSLSKNMVSLDISNNLGMWKGKCSGEACSYLLPLQSSIYFDKPGVQYLQLEQFTRIPSLKAIQEISLVGKIIGQK